MPCLSCLHLGLSAVTILDTNPLIPRNLSHESPALDKLLQDILIWLVAAAPLQAASDTAAFTAMAMKTVLKKNETTPCHNTARRITVVFTTTSETCAVIPTTKEK
jgi:hypothetical protein